MGFKKWIDRLSDGIDLDRREAYQLMTELLKGEYHDVQVSSVLTALRCKRETKEELLGFIQAVKEEMISFPRKIEVVDTCGSGGDQSGSFNASTAAALIASSAGVPVAKSGNRSSSSKCGSADLLEAIGIPLNLAVESASELLSTHHFTFLFTQQYHPRLKALAPLRKELGMRTVFNLLGPLCSPSSPTRQLIGVSNKEMAGLYAEILKDTGLKKGWIVHGLDGLDEISVCAPTLVYEVTEGSVRSLLIDPEELGIGRYTHEQIRGGETETNVKILERLLNGVESPVRDFCVVNAGAAIYLGGGAQDLEEGIQLAHEQLDSGKVKEHLENVIQYSKLLESEIHAHA